MTSITSSSSFDAANYFVYQVLYSTHQDALWDTYCIYIVHVYHILQKSCLLLNPFESYVNKSLEYFLNLPIAVIIIGKTKVDTNYDATQQK